MCSSCKMDPHEEKRFRYRQGAVDVDDFYIEVNYQTRMKGRGFKRKNEKPKTRPGCPENDFGPHVYVWTTEGQIEDLFFRYFGFHKYQRRICAGCGKMDGTKHSDAYHERNEREYNKRYPSTAFTIKRGAPVGRREIRSNYRPKLRWFSFESYDDGYVKYEKDYIARNGWNSFVCVF